MTYTTTQGDMWDSISYKTYGDTSYTDKILTLNAKYSNLYILPAGIVLTLPDTIENETDDSLPPWKQVNA